MDDGAANNPNPTPAPPILPPDILAAIESFRAVSVDSLFDTIERLESQLRTVRMVLALREKIEEHTPKRVKANGELTSGEFVSAVDLDKAEKREPSQPKPLPRILTVRDSPNGHTRKPLSGNTIAVLRYVAKAGPVRAKIIAVEIKMRYHTAYSALKDNRDLFQQENSWWSLTEFGQRQWEENKQEWERIDNER